MRANSSGLSASKMGLTSPAGVEAFDVFLFADDWEDRNPVESLNLEDKIDGTWRSLGRDKPFFEGP